MAWDKLKSLMRRKKDMPEGLWITCPGCRKLVYKRKVDEMLSVCPECSYHFPIASEMRIRLMLDKDSFQEMWTDLEPTDPLEFTAKDAYRDKIAEYRRKTGLKDACFAGIGAIYGRRVALALTDSRFMMGSMGSVVGEKLARLTELATREKLPLIIVSGSGGGARMYEGALSLMQMAKTCGALARFHDAGGLFISVLTHPTMAGVLASFASMGDVILAEPRALIGFTGPRVIAETIGKELPEGFQTSEFLLEHGLIDRIVHRVEMRNELVRILGYCGPDFETQQYKKYAKTDEAEHDAWVKAHETQKLEKEEGGSTTQVRQTTTDIIESDHDLDPGSEETHVVNT